ncbi:uncharacterized protein BO97DRAFT_279390 [Aspergillus homomorphus CBS 101889]|uniref:Uncharacterized protein n=1 Tax=Aspergillus homomorphus (strain CBS 101889) TaxID=1450537 RepID=A0A395HHZ0_ASPHC|nr:hypothetical protein BO97DRAFT_279390 [Aspergillus homomorphus CBS 101889]RAL06785.1 hypothetical protein BO97DRAFT_279390 [Aspergillus homomorphus CBS 101889]
MTSRSARKHPYASLTIPEAISAILSTIETIRLRHEAQADIEAIFKPHEKKKLQDAFSLRHSLRQAVQSKADERRDNYRHFLKKLDVDLVIPCALGLGQTTIGYMREHIRLRLPSVIQKRENEFKCGLIRALALKYSQGRICPHQHNSPS